MNRAKRDVVCSCCNVSYAKRVDSLKNWNGMCRICTGRHIVNTKIKGHIRVAKRYCVACGIEIYAYNSTNNCKACFQHPKGETHYKWKEDRSTLSKKQNRNDMAYKEWRRLVWVRDSYICKMKDSSCKGRIEAHHIYSWTKYQELRYDIDNGITLCVYHHPRKKEEERMMIPMLKELITIKNITN